MPILAELRRRNVLRMAAAYLAGSWLLLQIVETLLPAFDVDEIVLRYIVIALGIGLVPALAISWAFEWTPEGLKRDEGAAPPNEQSRTLARTWDRVIFLVMAFAVGFFAFDRFILQPQRDAALIEAATEAGAEMERSKAPVIPYESIAVLPFTNMSADPANEYFSDGLTETLLHMLAQIADLKVAARTSAFAFKDKNVDVRAIATELGVAHILEGSVQKSNNRVRITAQLIRAEDGYHVWSKHYDRTLDDVFAIQDEIALSVSSSLGSTLLAGSDGVVVGVFTENIDAYDIYLRALEQLALGTIESFGAAEELFAEALVIDPSFIDAKIGLVQSNFLRYHKGTSEFETTSVTSAQLLSEVLAVDPTHLVARQFDLRLRAVIANREMDVDSYRDLMDELFLTFQEGQGDPMLRGDVARYLAANSRSDEALQLVQDALVLDPLNGALLLAQGGLLWQTAGIEAAEQPFKTALKVVPDNTFALWALGALEINRHNIVEGMRYFRRVEILDPEDPNPTAELAITFTELGLYEHADRWLEDFKLRAHNPAMTIGVEVQAAAERNDEATLRRIVPAGLTALLDAGAADGIAGVMLNEYAVIMLADGKAQEGLDFFESYYPGISQVGGDAVTGWTEMNIQNRAILPLSEAVHDDATNRRNVEAFLALLEKSGITIREDQPEYVRIQFELNGLEAAKAAFLSTYMDEGFYILASEWHDFKRSPWSEELRADPEIAAAMATREARIAEIRDSVLELMKEPDWLVESGL